MQSGPEQLKAWMDRAKKNQAETATYLGMDFTYISQIVNGVRTPGLRNALIIERNTGIPVEAWADSEVGGLVGAITARRRKSPVGKA
jgi:transcriptional regulator with XRE-family HTH domain